MTLDEYIEALRGFDWWFEYSDDHRVWERGWKLRDRLREVQPLVDPDWQVWNQFAPDNCKVRNT